MADGRAGCAADGRADDGLWPITPPMTPPAPAPMAPPVRALQPRSATEQTTKTRSTFFMRPPLNCSGLKKKDTIQDAVSQGEERLWQIVLEYRTGQDILSVFRGGF
jgi:hypothetical protein